VSLAVAAYSDWLKQNVGVEPFSARDLRRTCESRLAALGITKDIRAQLLSHGISGVQAKHYDRYSYLTEKREALDQWAEYLDGLLEPSRKVVAFTSPRKRT
jgi:integrase